MIFMLGALFLLTSCQAEEIDPEPEEKVNLLSGTLLADHYIAWYGRTEYKQDRMYFYHTATGFKVRFYGRVVQLTLSLTDKNNDIYFSIAKDGESLLDCDVIVLSDFEETYQVSFETYDEHELEVVKRSEPEDGITSLKSVSTNGEFLEITPDEDRLHFLIVGASGISGHGALGSAGEPRTTENSSSLHSFGYLTAMHYGGSWEFVSNSGWGLKYGYNDRSGNVNIYEAYQYVGIDNHQDLIETPYDHHKVPDVVIVNIGGNDWNAVIRNYAGFEQQEKIDAFKAQVATFILTLREDAPFTHVIWTMTAGSNNGQAAVDVINLLDPEDKAFVHVVVIKQVGEDGDPVGADNHASYVTHQKSAQNIIDILDTLLIINGLI